MLPLTSAMPSPMLTLQVIDGFQPSPSESAPGQSSLLFQAIFNSLMQGVLILNQKRELVQANARALELCKLLNQQLGTTSRLAQQSAARIPESIWNLCRVLLSSRQEFPDMVVIPEEEIDLGDIAHLKVNARWLELSDADEPYILVTLEDQMEMLRNLACWDAHRYNLTAREAEVWLLRRQGYSYDEIADRLYISRNTVKKHLKSVSSKRGTDDVSGG